MSPAATAVAPTTPAADPFDRSPIAAPWLRMAVATFAILVLELALIRWVGTQVRVAAYFSNLVLIAAFLGMGLGVAVGIRRPGWFRFALPMLAALTAVLALAEPLDFVHFGFPDPAISLWGGERHATPLLTFVVATASVLACFWAIAATFLFAAVPVGVLFARMASLDAYRWDIAGSLAGIAAMTVLSFVGAPPAIWFALGTAALFALRPAIGAGVAALVVIAAAVLSTGAAQFSPYNRIDVSPLYTKPLSNAPMAPQWQLDVNRDYHQYMLDLRGHPQPRIQSTINRERTAAVYELPFRVQSARGSALVVGAGTGNDVAAALRNGYGHVTAVDIDGALIALGRERHPERPYADPRVEVVVDDARAYFERAPEGRYDVVCYGLLDSHAMFSAMSSLRLETYVYTVQGIAAGWRQVKDGGVLSVSFSTYAGEWMKHRMFAIIREATGRDPVVVPHRYNFGTTFLVGRDLTAERVEAIFPMVARDVVAQPWIKVPTDDWPFLYLRPDTMPWAYLVVLGAILATGTLAIRRALRVARGDDPAGTAGGIDARFALLGAGFMLVETRMVTELSLLFGSTWIVNTSVFAGILLMVLLANEFARRWPPRRPSSWFVPLIASLAALVVVGSGTLNALPLAARIAIAGPLFALPAFFAGIVFSGLLQRARDPAGALAANLGGAMIGGVLEYLSMLVGLRAIGLVAVAIYLVAMIEQRRREAADAPLAASLTAPADADS